MLFAASAKLARVLLSSALLSSSGPQAWTEPLELSLLAFADDDITPDSANSARFAIEQEGQRLSATGSHEQAAELYWLEGVRLKDPVLIIDAGEAWLAHARARRSIEAAQTAIERTAVALDMLYFLRDGATSSQWQPVAPEYLHMVLGRAETVVTDANTLIAEIEDEQARAAAAANAPVEEPRKRGPAKPGTALIAGGSAAMVLGLGGAGLGVAGLVLGAAAQADVEDPLVYRPEHAEAEARGRQANVLAGVGIGVAVVGVGVGAALIVLGVKQRKRAGAASAQLVPSFGPSGAGLRLVGRF